MNSKCNLSFISTNRLTPWLRSHNSQQFYQANFPNLVLLYIWLSTFLLKWLLSTYFSRVSNVSILEETPHDIQFQRRISFLLSNFHDLHEAFARDTRLITYAFRIYVKDLQLLGFKIIEYSQSEYIANDRYFARG